MKSLLLAALACVSLAAYADDEDVARINGSVHVTAPARDVSTVNGAIRIDEGISAEDVETVNGSITLGRNSSAKKVETVNGGISAGSGTKVASIDTVNGSLTLEEGVQVQGDVSAVNGSIRVARNADISGKVSNVNGRMQLEGAHVARGLETTNGDIEVGAGSRVDGGILVEKPNSGWFNWGKPRVPKIVIGPGAVVNGDLRFEHTVELYVSSRATIGRVHGATPIPFSGDAPSAADKSSADVKVEK